MKNKTYKTFIKYSFVGGLVFFVDTGSFLGLLTLGVYRPIASSVAFIIGIICHFSLNRWFSFQNFDRHIRHQIRTYIVVAAVSLSLTVIVIEIMAGLLRFSPLMAKISAVAINMPVSFVGHNFFTFGKGIRGTLKELLNVD